MKITEEKAIAIFHEVHHDCFVVAWNHVHAKDHTVEFRPFRNKEFRRAFYMHAAVFKLISMETYKIMCSFKSNK